MRNIDAMLTELDQEAQITRRVLERIPDDKLGWKPHPKSFSLGQLGLHIASLPGGFTAAIVNDTREVPSFSQPQPKSQQEILDTFSKGVESAKETLKTMDDARLASTWTLTRNGKAVLAAPRIGVLRSILLNHGYHHRGQLSVYLRMLDVPLPWIYGPSADEDPFG